MAKFGIILSREDQERSFLELLKLNPHPGIPFEDYKIKISKGKYKMKLYSWFTGEKEDILIDTAKLDKYLKEYSKLVLIDSQVYFDIIVFGFTDISQRPKCKNCGKETRWKKETRTYLNTCSENCLLNYQSVRVSKVGKNNTGKWTKERHDRYINIMKNKPKRVKTEEQKKEISEKLTKFYSTEKGKELKNHFRKTSQDNIVNRLVSDFDQDKIKRKGKSSYGYYESKYWNTIFKYDSSWELDFIKFSEMNSIFRDNIESFSRCKYVIDYKFNNLNKKYIPDFTLKTKSGIEIVVEIKPARLFNVDPQVRLKYQAALKFFKKKNIKYIVLTEKELYSSRRVNYTRWKQKMYGIIKSFNIFNYIV